MWTLNPPGYSWSGFVNFVRFNRLVRLNVNMPLRHRLAWLCIGKLCGGNGSRLYAFLMLPCLFIQPLLLSFLTPLIGLKNFLLSRSGNVHRLLVQDIKLSLSDPQDVCGPWCNRGNLLHNRHELIRSVEVKVLDRLDLSLVMHV